MAVIAGILLSVTLIIAVNIPSLVKQKLTKELFLFSIILLMVTSLSIAHALKIKIPSPLNLIMAIYQPIADLVWGLFY